MISCGARLAVFDIAELREVTSYDELELDTLGDRRTALFLIMSDTDDSFNFLISIRRMWNDGIFQVGSKFSKSYQFSDINYQVASLEDKKVMFLDYSELLNSLDSGSTTKITINNRRLNRANFEQSILMPLRGDSRDVYRREYNEMLLEKATGANGIMQEKYITITVGKKNIEDARTYFARVGADLTAHFAALGSKCVELDATERLRILHDFYRQGEEADFHFNARDMMKKGHDFRDYICPDGIEKHSDYLVLGGTFCRVLFLKDYANYIKDSFVTELTDMNRNLMLSIDVVPIPMDEAVREVENRLLGVETNITNWQRRQNANNNFSATIPYDMEQQRKESKEFLDDLTARDQRMMMMYWKCPAPVPSGQRCFLFMRSRPPPTRTMPWMWLRWMMPGKPF